jgi:hypothetical protein
MASKYDNKRVGHTYIFSVENGIGDMACMACGLVFKCDMNALYTGRLARNGCGCMSKCSPWRLNMSMPVNPALRAARGEQ